MVSVSGIRGTIGATLTPRIACDFGCAFGTMLVAQPPPAGGVPKDTAEGGCATKKDGTREAI